MNNSCKLLAFLDAVKGKSLVDAHGTVDNAISILEEFVREMRDGKSHSKVYALPRRIRWELHVVCQLLGFRHVSKIQGKKRMMHVSVDKDYELPTLEEWNARREQENARREQENARREQENARRERRKLEELENTRRKMKQIHCDYCFRNGTECDVGMMVCFPRIVVCDACYEKDDELNGYKWEAIFD